MQTIKLRGWILGGLFGGLVLSASVAPGKGAGQEEPGTANATPKAALVPHRNDVTIRTLELRGVPPGDPKDPFSAIKNFHANRFEWVYFDPQEDAADVKKARGMVKVFGGAGSSKLDDLRPPEGVGDVDAWRRSTASVDLAGHPVVFPHKRGWSREVLTGDLSNPDYFDGHLRHYTAMIDAGANALHRDEIRGGMKAVVDQGGGFTKTGIEGFAAWLTKNGDPATLEKLGISDPATFDYGDFLRKMGAPRGDAFASYPAPLKTEWTQYWREVDRDFWRRMLEAVNAHSKGTVVFSCNNSSLQVWDGLESQFDFAISELLLGSANPGHIYARSRAAEKAGRFQVFGAPKTRGTDVDPAEKLALTRKVIATAYASGAAGQVPWDIFQQSRDGLGRYYGKVSDYADLFGFVRGNDWAAYRVAGAVGPEIVESGFDGEKAVEISGGNENAYAFVNVPIAGAGSDTLPVLIHLVDWGKPLVPRPPLEQLSFEPTDSGERLYFSKDGKENLKRTNPEPFEVVVKPGALGLPNDANLEFTLQQPAQFTTELHEKVVQSGDFSAWVQESDLTAEKQQDGSFKVKIPALRPWGILAITPQ